MRTEVVARVQHFRRMLATPARPSERRRLRTRATRRWGRAGWHVLCPWVRVTAHPRTAKLALPIWDGGLAPVFDVAMRARILEVAKGRVVGRAEVPLPLDDGIAKVTWLADHGVTALVCGAITRPVETLAESRGIEVSAFLHGDAETILGAWLSGNLGRGDLRMPGTHREAGRAGNRPMNGASASATVSAMSPSRPPSVFPAADCLPGETRRHRRNPR